MHLALAKRVEGEHIAPRLFAAHRAARLASRHAAPSAAIRHAIAEANRAPDPEPTASLRSQDPTGKKGASRSHAKPQGTATGRALSPEGGRSGQHLGLVGLCRSFAGRHDRVGPRGWRRLHRKVEQPPSRTRKRRRERASASSAPAKHAGAQVDGISVPATTQGRPRGVRRTIRASARRRGHNGKRLRTNGSAPVGEWGVKPSEPLANKRARIAPGRGRCGPSEDRA
jgi:hypothetical protein